MISIIDKQGVAESQQSLKHLNGVLGTSVFKGLFTGEVVTDISKIGNELLNKFIVLIVDYPERWNGLLYGKATIEEAEQLAKEASLLKQDEYRVALDHAGLNGVKIWDWYRFLGDVKYERNQAILKDYFHKNKEFRKRLITQTVNNVGPKIVQTEKRLGRKITRAERENISMYLLEELGGLFYLFFDLGFPIDVYPGKNAWLIDEIFQNKYPELSEALEYDWSKWGYIQLSYTENGG